jgi:hypothetical protein
MVKVTRYKIKSLDTSLYYDDRLFKTADECAQHFEKEQLSFDDYEIVEVTKFEALASYTVYLDTVIWAEDGDEASNIADTLDGSVFKELETYDDWTIQGVQPYDGENDDDE